jgi:hypothetical protein
VEASTTAVKAATTAVTPAASTPAEREGRRAAARHGQRRDADQASKIVHDNHTSMDPRWPSGMASTSHVRV